MATRVVTVNDILDGHVGLDLECFDRIYLHGWVATLQVPGQVVSFLTRHLGFPIPSPALLERIGLRFRKAVSEFAAGNDIPVVRFAKGERKLEVMRPYLDRLARDGRTGVAAIGVAQEFQRVFTGTTYHSDADGGGVPRFGYAKADRRVSAYYFYLVDEVFGPAFIKVCAYFPYPIKIWLNGHEYAKRRARAAGIGFTELDNGFATTDDPAALQRICDTLTSGTIRVFCERWWSRLPLPLTEVDRAAGYWWDISMRQVEVSRTLVFDAPRQARGFFEALCTDNLDIGRPEEMQIIFGRRVRTPPPGGYRTRLLRTGDEVTLNAYFRHSRVKSYLKCGRAFRIETVINDTGDLGLLRGLEHLEELSVKARDVNRRMVDAFRVGQGCVLASPAFERVARPSLVDGRRAPALRFARPSGHGPGRRLVCRRTHHHRVHQPEPSRPGEHPARCPVPDEPDDLRPAPTPPQRPDHPAAPHQHLRPHRRGPASRDLLHQALQPAAAATARRPRPTRTPRPAPSPPGDQPPR
jgi:hypothetical protein